MIPRPGACKAHIKDQAAFINKKPTLAVQEVAPQRPKRIRLSHPRKLDSRYDEETKLAVDEFAETPVTKSRVFDPNAWASQNKSRRRAQTEGMTKHTKKQEKASKDCRTQLISFPKDEVILLQICVNLKDVIAWGNISGFWNMVQDTLQLETGKTYKNLSRHVGILVRNRRAEQEEIEQRGKISISRVSAGCRPLLDKWIAGGDRIHHFSPNTLTPPSLDGDKEDRSLGNEIREQPESDELEYEVQKRAATDAWIDTSCDTKRCKKLEPCTSDLVSGTSNSYADSRGCWSLSGSSVTSDSSLENKDDNDVENGD